MSRVIESLFGCDSCVIPLADVQHIEKLSDKNNEGCLFVIMKSTLWNFENDIWENPVYLNKEESLKFLQAYKRFRYDLDNVQSLEPTERPLNKEKEE